MARWVVERMGPWKREADAGSALFGVLKISAVPDNVEHVGADATDDHTARPGGGWLTATFEKGVVHVELVVNLDAMQNIDAEKQAKGQAIPILDEVRFYVPKAGGG